MAWLKAEPKARAIIFDLPQVVPMARKRFSAPPFAGRVEVYPGDFQADYLPMGADLAWVSAIIHQNSPAQNLALYDHIAAALEPGDWIHILNIVMESSRIAPATGDLFAVNMLSGAKGGNCYSFDEIRKDLEIAGFTDVELVRRDEGMHSVVRGHLW